MRPFSPQSRELTTGAAVKCNLLLEPSAAHDNAGDRGGEWRGEGKSPFRCAGTTVGRPTIAVLDSASPFVTL